MSGSATTFINGRWSDPAVRWEVTNPAGGSVVGAVGYGGAEEAFAAADAAATARPMGGVKRSGLGREGGWEGLEEFQDVQYLAMAP